MTELEALKAARGKLILMRKAAAKEAGTKAEMNSDDVYKYVDAAVACQRRVNDLDALIAKLEAEGADGPVVMAPLDIKYVSGDPGDEG